MQSLSETIRPLSVEDFHAMSQAGIFGPDERVELLDGVPVTMPPIGPPHNFAQLLASSYLSEIYGRAAAIGGAASLIVGPASELQPDILILRREALLGAPRYWSSSDVLAAVEIADSSLKRDIGVKALAYSQGGIENYVVIDVADQTIFVHRRPADDGYAIVERFTRGGRFSLDLLPHIELEVMRFFPAI